MLRGKVIKWEFSADNEYFETASKFSQLFQSKATDEQMLEALKGPEGDYERDSFGIFFSVRFSNIVQTEYLIAINYQRD